MATKKKMVPVTSVTPASKVKAVSKAQQARTRNLVMGIASATPVGRAAKVTGTVSKLGKAKKVARTLVEPKSGVRVKSAVKKTSSQSSTVKKVPRNTAPKTGLETRGAKPTTIERINRARDLQWDKAERSYDAGNEMLYTGLVSSKKGRVAARGPGKKNVRKRDAIRREANKNLPIQIKSDRSFTSPTSGNMFRGTDLLKANNARALKAANKSKKKK